MGFSYGWGYSYGYGGFGIGGYYGGYGYAGLGYGWGYGFGYGYGWGGYGWGYGVSYLGTASPGSIDDLNDLLADAQEDFDAAAQAAHIARVTSLADDAIAKATNLDAAYRLLVQTQGDADVAYATAVGNADIALEAALQPAYLTRTTARASADKTRADTLQNAVVTQTTTVATLDNSYQSLWATAAVAQATGIATAEIDGWIASQTAAAASAQATALASGTAADRLAAVQAQATVAGLQALRPGYIASQQNHAAADANLSVSLTAATGARHVSNETATRDFLQAAGHAQRLREIADEAASGLYYHSLALADASRQIAAAANQADYRLDAATAQGTKQIADAQAAKILDLALAADPDAYDPYGYPTSTATDDYQKAAADSELARQLSLAAALQRFQVDDAVSRRDYTIAEANANDAYDRSLALAAKTFRDSVATAQRTRATADANSDRTYSLAAATAERNHRGTLSNANTVQQTSLAAADVAAYGHIHQEYDLPYTNYLHGLATLRQLLTGQLVPAAGTLTTDRNAASATHATTVATAAHDRDLVFADAARDRELAASLADYNRTVGQLDAASDFYAAVSAPAVAYATTVAAANQTRTAAVATAERDFQYQQVDGNQQAYSNRQAAITAADNVRDLALATAESSWWSAEAGAHADRAVADAAADHAWTIATLAADQARLVAEGQAQKTLRDTQATAYHTAETAWATHEHAFYLAEANASSLLSSALNDPWSIQADALRSSRRQSDLDRLTASKNQTLAAIDAQRTMELAVSGAQQTILVGAAANQQVHGSATSAAYWQLTTALANTYRLAPTGGSQLVLATASATLPGTLAIAAQIGYILSAAGWQAISDQVADRMEQWIRQIPAPGGNTGFPSVSQPEGLLPSLTKPPANAVTGLAPSSAPEPTAGRATVPVVTAALSSPAQAPTASGSLSSGVAITLVGYRKPAKNASKTTTAAEKSAVAKQRWSERQINAILKEVAPEIQRWLTARQARLQVRSVAGDSVTIHADTSRGYYSVLYIDAGNDLTSGEVAKEILVQFGTITKEFEKIVSATKLEKLGFYGLWGGWSPWEDERIGKAPDPFMLADALLAEKQAAVAELQAELDRYAGYGKTAVFMTTSGAIYVYLEAVDQGSVFDQAKAGGQLVLASVGVVGKLVSKLDAGTVLVRVDNAFVNAAARRNSIGTVSGGVGLRKISSNNSWFKGTHGSFAEIPAQVATSLRGKSFNNFDDFRNAFWKAVAADADLAVHFKKANLTRMQNGLAPIAPGPQHYGEMKSYILHHRNPIHNGGDVYSLDNLLIVSPRYHQSILAPAYHFKK